MNLERIDHASPKDWPLPKQIVGTTTDMGQLFRHMRNAVCHGRVAFYGESKDGPDSRFVTEVTLEFTDRRAKGAEINWQVLMDGKDLRLFLNKLINASLDI